MHNYPEQETLSSSMENGHISFSLPTGIETLRLKSQKKKFSPLFKSMRKILIVIIYIIWEGKKKNPYKWNSIHIIVQYISFWLRFIICNYKSLPLLGNQKQSYQKFMSWFHCCKVRLITVITWSGLTLWRFRMEKSSGVGHNFLYQLKI